MEFKRTVFEFDIYGKKVEVSAITVNQYRQYKERFLAGKEDPADVIADTLVSLGLPKEIADDMETHHLGEMLNALSKGKKKGN